MTAETYAQPYSSGRGGDMCTFGSVAAILGLWHPVTFERLLISRIAFFTFISKVVERIVAAQLKAFLVEADSMPPMQSAYRAGHSTETATLKVVLRRLEIS